MSLLQPDVESDTTIAMMSIKMGCLIISAYFFAKVRFFCLHGFVFNKFLLSLHDLSRVREDYAQSEAQAKRETN
jgi:hypothetical protein